MLWTITPIKYASTYTFFLSASIVFSIAKTKDTYTNKGVWYYEWLIWVALKLFKEASLALVKIELLPLYLKNLRDTREKRRLKRVLTETLGNEHSALKSRSQRQRNEENEEKPKIMKKDAQNSHFQTESPVRSSSSFFQFVLRQNAF